jgi:hypothetical protein
VVGVGSLLAGDLTLNRERARLLQFASIRQSPGPYLAHSSERNNCPLLGPLPDQVFVAARQRQIGLYPIQLGKVLV